MPNFDWPTECPQEHGGCTPCVCRYSEESERAYVERMRMLRASDGSPHLRVNGGTGDPRTTTRRP